MNVDTLLERAKGQVGRDRLQSLTRVFDEINEMPTHDLDLEREVAKVTLVRHGIVQDFAGESLGMESGLWWLVVATPLGYRNGYVRVPDSHPWVALKPWDGIDGTRRRVITDGPMMGAPDFTDESVARADEIGSQVSIHRPLNYGGTEPVPGAPAGWWFGFDCAQPGDRLDPALALTLEAEVAVPTDDDGIRTNAYVRDEVRELARQLASWA